MSDQAIQLLRLSDMPMASGAFTPLLSSADAEQDLDYPDELPVAQDDPYARGLADGQQMAAAAFDIERRQLQALLAAAEGLQPEPSDELAVLIGETVGILVTQIVGSVPIDREMLNTRAKQAADLVAECDAARTLWLHPDDVALLDKTAFAMDVLADPKAERGSVRIDCSAGWIEHGTALYLDQLRTELGLAGDVK